MPETTPDDLRRPDACGPAPAPVSPHAHTPFVQVGITALSLTPEDGGPEPLTGIVSCTSRFFPRPVETPDGLCRGVLRVEFFQASLRGLALAAGGLVEGDSLLLAAGDGPRPVCARTETRIGDGSHYLVFPRVVPYRFTRDSRSREVVRYRAAFRVYDAPAFVRRSGEAAPTCLESWWTEV